MGKTTGEVEPVDPFDRTRGEWAARGAPAAGDTVDETSVNADAEAAEIRSGIEQTRAEMGQTIGALQEKLDPSRIADQVKEQIRERATEAYDSAKESLRAATIGRAEKMMENVSDTVSDMSQRAGAAVSDTSSWIVDLVRENPIAFALIGAGLGALALNTRNRQSSYGSPYSAGRRGYLGPEYGRSDYQRSYGDREWDTASDQGVASKAREMGESVAETARAAKERVSGVVSSAAASVRDTASTVADTTREQVSHLTQEVRYRARGAGDLFNSTLQENPLALGVAALAAGALMGLVLPSTRVESEYLGEAREQFVDKAKTVARDTAEKVQRVTEEAARTLNQPT